MDWLTYLSDYSFWEKVGSFGSVVGALFTLIAFVYQLKTRRHYKLLIRGPELKRNLIRVNSQLNQYSELSSQQRKTVLEEARILFKNVGTVLGFKQRMKLWWVRFWLWWQWRSATTDQVEYYFAKIHGLIVHIRSQIRNKQVEQ